MTTEATPVVITQADIEATALADMQRRVEELEGVLEPFASFCDTFVDDDGWKGPMNKERIVDWFGPSDFRAARQSLSDKTKDKNDGHDT